MPVTTYARKNLEEMYRNHAGNGYFKAHRATIEHSLRAIGADFFDMSLPETRILPLIIHPAEIIEGIVYGRYRQDQLGGYPLVGRGVVVATDQRVLLIDKKPLFVRCDEISYYVVSGIRYSKAGFAGTVTLHTRVGNINVRTFNQECAHNFVESVEAHIFNGIKEAYDDNQAALWPIQAD